MEVLEHLMICHMWEKCHFSFFVTDKPQGFQYSQFLSFFLLIGWVCTLTIRAFDLRVFGRVGILIFSFEICNLILSYSSELAVAFVEFCKVSFGVDVNEVWFWHCQGLLLLRNPTPDHNMGSNYNWMKKK